MSHHRDASFTSSLTCQLCPVKMDHMTDVSDSAKARRTCGRRTRRCRLHCGRLAPHEAEGGGSHSAQHARGRLLGCSYPPHVLPCSTARPLLGPLTKTSIREPSFRKGPAPTPAPLPMLDYVLKHLQKCLHWHSRETYCIMSHSHLQDLSGVSCLPHTHFCSSRCSQYKAALSSYGAGILSKTDHTRLGWARFAGFVQPTSRGG